MVIDYEHFGRWLDLDLTMFANPHKGNLYFRTLSVTIFTDGARNSILAFRAGNVILVNSDFCHLIDEIKTIALDKGYEAYLVPARAMHRLRSNIYDGSASKRIESHVRLFEKQYEPAFIRFFLRYVKDILGSNFDNTKFGYMNDLIIMENMTKKSENYLLYNAKFISILFFKNEKKYALFSNDKLIDMATTIEEASLAKLTNSFSTTIVKL